MVGKNTPNCHAWQLVYVWLPKGQSVKKILNQNNLIDNTTFFLQFCDIADTTKLLANCYSFIDLSDKLHISSKIHDQPQWCSTVYQMTVVFPCFLYIPELVHKGAVFCRHVAAVRSGNLPHTDCNSGLNHDKPLIPCRSFPHWQLPSFSPSFFHVSMTFLLSACQKPTASGVAVWRIWRRNIMILSLRSHLFSPRVLVVGQVNCRHHSSAACIIYLWSMSTWCVVNAHSQSFLNMIFHTALFHLCLNCPSFLANTSLFSSLSSRCDHSARGRLACLSHWTNGKNHPCGNGCLVGLLS